MIALLPTTELLMPRIPPQSRGEEDRRGLYFTDIFDVSQEALEEYGAFNISLLVDLPLFVDPFLLFNSSRPEYQDLHQGIIRYLRFLCDRSSSGDLNRGLLKAWYHFSEVKETWLGFSRRSNTGHGLGGEFAKALDNNLSAIFSNFGQERITKGSHLEKLCLIGNGVGRDTISDFTTNLIKKYLAAYTQEFARNNIDPKFIKRWAVLKAEFDYATASWKSLPFDLPTYAGSYVLLTPKDILTKDDIWINKTAFYRDFEDIPQAISNAELRAQLDNYFRSILPREPKRAEINEAIWKTVLQFPEVIDYFIKRKEDTGDQAKASSEEKVLETFRLFVEGAKKLIHALQGTDFYSTALRTEQETRSRIEYLKDVIENKGGHRIFYVRGQPIRKESDLQILFRLVWYGTSLDVSREVNDGRGPVDFKVSEGALDKTLVEMKLASNSKLEQNLKSQAEIYQRASDAPIAFKVIAYFTEAEKNKLIRILRRVGLEGHKSVVLIDARNDNKPSGSNA
jgi:hypothetical protein